MDTAEAKTPESSATLGDLAAGLPNGTAIGDALRVVQLLGRGGMGEVYEAEHVRLGRRFAVKVLRAHLDKQAQERFRREWRTIARLSSEYVVNVIDCGELRNGTPYLVMERLIGWDLRQLLDEASPLPIPRAVGLIEQACLGIAAAHRAGVVHRDLKPANLFVTPRETGDELCKVLDFGVAKVETSEATQQGAVIGTVKYMAPEQLTDSASVGPAADIYALGAILYECLTGTPPHVSATLQETMFKILNERPEPLRERRENVPDGLAAVIDRTLARDPQERFASAEELSLALRPFSRPREPAARASSDSTSTTELHAPLAPRTRSPRVAPWISGALGVALGFGVAQSFSLVAPTPAARAGEDPAPAALSGPTSGAELRAAVAPTTTPTTLASVRAVPSSEAAPTVEAAQTSARRRRPSPPSSAGSTRSGDAPQVAFDRENPYD